MPGYTPMMEQYFALKNQYPDCLLFFRLGDFYEMFFDDALTASQALDITLTGRDCGQAERAPMCGVPFHAADGYIAKLVEKGYHVAICEQTEDPKQAKGLVKREVIRVVTPGTVTDAHMLDEKKHNYIVCLHKGETHIGCAAADVTTGLFTAAAIPEESENRLADELTRLMPAEMLISEGFPYRAVAESIAGIKAAPVPAWTFHQNNAFKCLTQHFKTHHLEGFGLSQNAPEIPAAGALMQYLYETQKSALPQITSLKIASQNTRMTIDGPSRRNLELTQSASGQKGKKLSLFGILDFTKTAMGARALRGWVEQPLLSPEEINKRLDSVEEWFKKPLLRAELRELLQSVHDLERLIAKLAGASANARDLSALRASVKHLPHIGTLLSDAERDLNAEIYRTFDDLSDIYAKIDGVITDEPPVSIREGGMIRRGCDAELDRLLDVKENGGKWLSELEAREREQTGIKNLKIRHNKVFGYYIEITNSQLQNAPERYVRRQTLANCERFITEELKDLEDTILGADEKQTELEYRLFDTLRREIVEEIARIQFMAYELAALDALQSLANAAERGGYVKPAVSGGGSVVIKEGRHPVVEQLTGHAFVPNDTDIDGKSRRLSIITGPNMAGKSTYMRQVALIVLMAQIGSFVPASSAKIGVVDRIFTRVGASDDLATGQSTFMVEMTEVANILHNATARSLVLLDEIGRGTSTFDGLSIAWAVLEHIAANVGAKTLFATHYHELTELEGAVSGVVNYCFTVREQGEEVVFLRKLTRGGADHSFGIHVARLAGLPETVLARARTVLSALNEADIAKNTEKLRAQGKRAGDGEAGGALPEENTAEETARKNAALAEALKRIDIDRTTPLEAIVELERLHKMIES